MKKILILLSVAVLCSIVAKAQDPSALATSAAVAETQNVQGEVVEYPSEVLAKSMEASLAKSGRALGEYLGGPVPPGRYAQRRCCTALA